MRWSWLRSSLEIDILNSLKSCLDISRSWECETLNVICCSGVNLPRSASATWSKDSIRSQTTSIRSTWRCVFPLGLFPDALELGLTIGASWRHVQGLISLLTAQWRLELAANPSSVYSNPDMVLLLLRINHHINAK